MQVVFYSFSPLNASSSSSSLLLLNGLSFSGETLNGIVVLENSENIKIRGRFV